MAELFNRLNWVDLVALILLLRIAYISSRIGVGKQIIPLCLLVLILLITLHNYEKVAWIFVDRYAFSKTICLFSSYAFMLTAFFVIYHIASKLVGALPEIIPMAPLERFVGIAIGLVRAVLIIGMLFMGFLLAPGKSVSNSVKNSYSGRFFISVDLNIFSSISNIFGKGKVHASRMLGTLTAPKPHAEDTGKGLKDRARFFKEKY